VGCRTALDCHLTDFDARERTRRALRLIEQPELVADGAGTISSSARVECFECGAEATGFDERAGVHLCDDCDSAAAVTDHEAVVRAYSLIESDARFVVICFDCRRSDSFVEETEAVEQARDDDRTLDCECGGEYELVIDAATDPGVRHTDPSVAADLEDGVPRCRKCGEVIVIRSGPAYESSAEKPEELAPPTLRSNPSDAAHVPALRGDRRRRAGPDGPPTLTRPFLATGRRPEATP
jgi:hypothetical protein